MVFVAKGRFTVGVYTPVGLVPFKVHPRASTFLKQRFLEMNLNVALPGFGVSLCLHERCLICFLFSTCGFGSSRAGRVLMAASCADFFLFLAKPW